MLPNLGRLALATDVLGPDAVRQITAGLQEIPFPFFVVLDQDQAENNNECRIQLAVKVDEAALLAKLLEWADPDAAEVVHKVKATAERMAQLLKDEVTRRLDVVIQDQYNDGRDLEPRAAVESAPLEHLDLPASVAAEWEKVGIPVRFGTVLTTKAEDGEPPVDMSLVQDHLEELLTNDLVLDTVRTCAQAAWVTNPLLPSRLSAANAPIDLVRWAMSERNPTISATSGGEFYDDDDDDDDDGGYRFEVTRWTKLWKIEGHVAMHALSKLRQRVLVSHLDDDPSSDLLEGRKRQRLLGPW